MFYSKDFIRLYNKLIRDRIVILSVLWERFLVVSVMFNFVVIFKNLFFIV